MPHATTTGGEAGGRRTPFRSNCSDSSSRESLVGLAGGEIEHYAIALIGPGTPCIILCSNDDARAEILSNAAQVKARGGLIIGSGPENNPIFDEYLPVPDGGSLSPLQILAYYLACARGYDPDMPRNLAKSVTVK